MGGFSYEGFDPSGTLWQTAFASKGGNGEWINDIDLKDNTMAMFLSSGAEQANAFCRLLARKNELEALGVKSVCCQHYAIEFTEGQGFLAT